MRDFSGFHGDLFGIFGRESPYSATISGMKVFTQKKDRVSKVYPQGTFSRVFSTAIRLFRKKFAAGNELFCKSPATVSDFFVKLEFSPITKLLPAGRPSSSMIPDADEDPFPHVVKVDRLYPEEQDFVADDISPLSPYKMADLDEPATKIDLPALLPGEDPDPPAEKVAGRAGPLDEPAVSRDMKKADEQVTLSFFKKDKEKLRRPWDGPDLG